MQPRAARLAAIMAVAAIVALNVHRAFALASIQFIPAGFGGESTQPEAWLLEAAAWGQAAAGAALLGLTAARSRFAAVAYVGWGIAVLLTVPSSWLLSGAALHGRGWTVLAGVSLAFVGLLVLRLRPSGV